MPTWRVIESGPESVERSDETFSTEAQARTRRNQRRDRAGRVNRISLHLCPHAAGEDSMFWYNCKTDPRAQYEEF